MGAQIEQACGDLGVCLRCNGSFACALYEAVETRGFAVQEDIGQPLFVYGALWVGSIVLLASLFDRSRKSE